MKTHYIDGHYIGSLVSKITMGLDKKLWLATSHGIETLDIAQHKYGIAFENSSIQNISDFRIDEENDSVLMIAEGGLYYLKWNGTQLIMPEDKYHHILPKINFSKITHYKDDIYLITTEGNGIVEFNINTSQYKLYTSDNGLPSNIVLDVLMIQDTPIIVTKTGIATFNRQFQEHKQEKPKIMIDSLKLNNQELALNDTTLILQHNYGSLNFDVTLLAFYNSSSIEYEYMLEGHNDSWTANGSDDKYSFNNLKSGNYTFKIKGRSNYSLWSDTIEYAFVVNPPTWMTWWAYLFYTLILFMIILWISYLYRRKLLYEHEIAKQQTKKELAKAASKAKSEFLAKVSHEVRTPLNGVLGMGELMQGTELDKEQKIYTDSIMTSGNHLLDIINDILDLSKIEAGKLDLEMRSFDLLLLIDEVTESFTSLAIQKKLLFIHCFNHDVNRLRVGDVIRVKQILFNLLSNAFKFTNQGEIILEVKNTANDPNSIIISVKDTGIGINNDKIDQLFKPFVQADSTVTRKFGGTGLGLAIVKQLAEKMDGHVTASNQNKKGSIFRVKLKLKVETQPLNKTNEYTDTICLLVNQNKLRQSLIEYCQLTGVKHSSNIEANTQYVFLDTFSNISQSQESQLQHALKHDIPLIFIGFELNQFQQKYKQHATLITPPFSFNNFESLCSYNDDKLHKNTQPSKINTLKILLIEDNPINQQVCYKMLRKRHHKIEIADDAKTGLGFLQSNKYDLLIVDYHLPGMDGLTMIKKWQNPEQVPIIVLTADLTDALYSKCQKLNITNVVSKPFSQSSLFSAIDKITH
jgi:signal transduction histidine kinase